MQMRYISSRTLPFVVDGTALGLADWQAVLQENGSTVDQPASWIDPSRDTTAYLIGIGHTVADLSDLVEVFSGQSKTNWDQTSHGSLC